MIFSRSRTILSINSAAIAWAKGDVLGGKLLGETQRKPWSEENLRLVVSDIAKNFPHRVRIVVGEEFSYATSFAKDKDIATEIRRRIPEDVKDGWDFMVKNQDMVQVIAVQEKIFLLIRKLFFEAGLQVEAIETESAAISRLLPKTKKETFLFARYDSVVVMGAARSGAVLTSQVFDEFPEVADIHELIGYLANRHESSVNRVYLQEKEAELEDVLQQAGLEVEMIPLDPMVGICKKRHLRGRDSDVLNIRLEEGNTSKKKVRHVMTMREKMLFAIFATVLMLCSIFVYSMLKSRNDVRGGLGGATHIQGK